MDQQTVSISIQRKCPAASHLPLHVGGQVVISAAKEGERDFLDDLAREQSHPSVSPDMCYDILSHTRLGENILLKVTQLMDHPA